MMASSSSPVVSPARSVSVVLAVPEVTGAAMLTAGMVTSKELLATARSVPRAELAAVLPAKLTT